ncbi:MAG: hypothetical protein AAGI71_12585 [Bacteroidota bacterium]
MSTSSTTPTLETSVPSPPAPPVYLGAHALHTDPASIAGELVTVDGLPCYRITDYDRMEPFFMSVVSDADHWLFLSSTGALTAGRQSPDHALFPYITVDKIHDAQDQVGGFTRCLVHRDGRRLLWAPFSGRYEGVYNVRRTLYKSIYGNLVRFEETNEDLGLTLRVTWTTSDRFGFVRQALLTNHGAEAVQVEVLDGLQHLLASGVERALQNERSLLVDAYKQQELHADTGLGLFSLSATPIDRPEPSEALQATVAWAVGLPVETHLLSMRQVEAFCSGQPLTPELLIRGQRAAYLVQSTLTLAPGVDHTWEVVADLNRDAADVRALMEQLADPMALRAALRADIQAGTDHLRLRVGQADGLQQTGEPLTAARHYANVLFNIMRGGVFDTVPVIDRDEWIGFVERRNTALADAQADALRALPARLAPEALAQAVASIDPQLERLALSYLPLTFSRRHGDPSRPWNFFSIDLRHPDGTLRRQYQGNWRDIFQNWEALGRAYPNFLPSMVAVFVNASTADGYNPYRITQDGIDWEVEDPDDPWSYIGYWGDHQIIYLLALLEQLQAHQPGLLNDLLRRHLFTYARVPYRIKPHAALLANPRDSIDFDEALHEELLARQEELGGDGVLLRDAEGDVYLASLAEKLLTPVLVKLTNLVPGGGVWMNTQRPEWNDANNALAGYGLSVVTVGHLCRHLAFLRPLFASAGEAPFALSDEVATLLEAVSSVLATVSLDTPLTAADRQEVVDALGQAGEAYRTRVYDHGLSAPRPVSPETLDTLFARAQTLVHHTLRANRRDDGLYHAYNLLTMASEGLGVRRLYAMLEGQVSALGSGLLAPEEAVTLLDALRESALYRADQHSYLLYPDRHLPGFLEKNVVPADAVASSALLRQILDDGQPGLVVRDLHGDVHFAGGLCTRDDVDAALDHLAHQGYAEGVAADREAVLRLFEEVFDHEAYTGRSGTFFGFEGLGSIYWHMVSKLVLAVQEVAVAAHDAGAHDLAAQLAERYEDLREGLGVTKSPAVHGAIPTDPYSHTPSHAGARQPGMTGQVKEDILCRWGELGVRVKEGRLWFDPFLLRAAEFTTAPTTFPYIDLRGATQALPMEAGMLAFTYAQVPVRYHRGGPPHIEIRHADGTVTTVEGLDVPTEVSQALFARTGTVLQIDVWLEPGR